MGHHIRTVSCFLHTCKVLGRCLSLLEGIKPHLVKCFKKGFSVQQTECVPCKTSSNLSAAEEEVLRILDNMSESCQIGSPAGFVRHKLDVLNMKTE